MTDDFIYVAKIAYSTSVDGVGLRNSLYVSGCPLRCSECHNKAWWELKSGKPYSIQEVSDMLNSDDFNISILGGEPLMQYRAIVKLCKLIKDHYPEKTIWLWSGYTLEEIQVKFPDILTCIDVLVDGPFIKEKAEPNLLFRGSSNQRIINVKNIIFETV